MRTNFSATQLADPATASSESILRACVHCGFCNATCPTYVERGDELDSPRGRIYLIRDMLEQGGAPPDSTVTHIDRCLSCLGCMTTCPSGVDYMHLVDHARSHIAAHYQRPATARALRAFLGFLLPRENLFRLAVGLGRIASPVARFLPATMRRMVQTSGQGPVRTRQAPKGTFQAHGTRRMRVALLTGCVQPGLAPEINAATIRLLIRHGVEVVVPPSTGCCGALTHHMGATDRAKNYARANISSWMNEVAGEGLDHIVINTSGCGVHVRDYGHLLRDDHAFADDAALITAMALDISELAAQLNMSRAANLPKIRVAYHPACSLQHGQRQSAPVEELLQAVGFDVRVPDDAHLCCGAAGTYTLLQQDLSDRLRQRKIARLHATAPDVIAGGNVGCQIHLADATDIPVLHTVQLLDWATGGPCPPELDQS